MGKIFQAIDKQIIKPRAVAAEREGFQMTKEDIESFYMQGDPKRYERTGAYGESPESTGVSGGNGNYDYNIHLNRPAYSTGTPGFPVLEEAQYHGSGILGRAGTWFEAQQDIEEALKKNFT